MKNFFSTNYSQNSFNLATLLLRLTFGLVLLLNHGLLKLKHFGQMSENFSDPLHIGHTASLGLVVFAEVLCALLLVLGLFTRFAALVLVISMAVAFFIVLKGQATEVHEPALLYLTVFFALLLVGPGRISVDAMMGK
ncbi:MAG: DoxX family protein [Bacteroidota bacterium]|nr:DoxX family protein [Bacteroidota bacterium]MDP4218490.1 DoxX family protein [Bacteroidota bacterium]MDP4247592.1 DoxX family protein [Bacteroidota bacterium]MDP4255149.1 DoxX family protein [Bacteroidota bacterium]MDP4260183.1 DoxX family protein [Bacteroidota bacterium]